MLTRALFVAIFSFERFLKSLQKKKQTKKQISSALNFYSFLIDHCTGFKKTKNHFLLVVFH